MFLQQQIAKHNAYKAEALACTNIAHSVLPWHFPGFPWPALELELTPITFPSFEAWNFARSRFPSPEVQVFKYLFLQELAVELYNLRAQSCHVTLQGPSIVCQAAGTNLRHLLLATLYVADHSFSCI